MTYTLWAKHEKVKRGWMPMMDGLTEAVGVNELVARQDRVRRSGEPCRFKLLPDGEIPGER